MSRPEYAALREALTEAGEGWALRYWGDRADGELDRLLGKLSRFTEEYQRRYVEPPDPFRLLRDNPIKGTAFFQMDTLRLSAGMMCAVWRILLGADIRSLRLEVMPRERMVLRLELATPGGGTEVFESQEPSDFRLLRHLGTVEVSGKLELQGYYALKGAGLARTAG